MTIKPIRPHTRAAWKLARINREAFPKLERTPVRSMFSFARQSDTDVLGLYDGEELAGFSVVMKNSSSAYLFYLAIDRKKRGMGYGSQALAALREFYPDHQLILDFEVLDPEADNYGQRLRRKEFYLRNGYSETGFSTYLRGAEFEVVCTPAPLQEESFRELLREIHRLVPEFPVKLYRLGE